MAMRTSNTIIILITSGANNNDFIPAASRINIQVGNRGLKMTRLGGGKQILYKIKMGQQICYVYKSESHSLVMLFLRQYQKKPITGCCTTRVKQHTQRVWRARERWCIPRDAGLGKKCCTHTHTAHRHTQTTKSWRIFFTVNQTGNIYIYRKIKRNFSGESFWFDFFSNLPPIINVAQIRDRRRRAINTFYFLFIF